MRRLRAHRHVGARALLALALIGSTPAVQESEQEELPSARVLDLVAALGSASAGEARAELAALHEELAQRAESETLDLDAEIALLRTCLVLGAGESGHVREAQASAGRFVEATGNYDQAALQILRLADTAFGAGQLEVALEATRFGLEAPGFQGAWQTAPRLWLLRAEIAREEGRWHSVPELLDLMEGRLYTEEFFEENPEFLPHRPYDRQFRSRLHAARGQYALGLGLVDRVEEEVRLAFDAAQASGFPGAVAVVRLLQIDLALSGEDYAGVVRLAEEAARAPEFDGLHASTRALFPLARGTAEWSLERRQLTGGREPGTSVARRTLGGVLESGDLPLIQQLRAHNLLADVALFHGELEVAEEHVDASTALAEVLGATRWNRSIGEEAFLSALRWRLAFARKEDRETLAAVREELARTFRDMLEEWRTTELRPGGIGFLHVSQRTHVLETLMHATLVLAPPETGDELALGHLLEAQAMGTRARRGELEVPSVADVQDALLAPGRSALVLFAARDRSRLFVVEQADVTSFDLPASHVLRELAGPVMRSLRQRGGRDASAALERLSDTLLPAPVRNRVATWDELYLVGFDRLEGLPGEVLTPRGMELLGHACAVATLPSLPLGLDLDRRARRAAREATDLDLRLIVAPDSMGRPDVVTLPFGREERGRLVRPFDVVEVIEGERATLELVRGAGNLEGARVTHLLAHGAYLPERERGAAIRLWRAEGDGETPGFLGADEIDELVVGGVFLLSTCSAAKGPQRIGDDALAHLGGALLDAGASCVVLARQPVEYAATLAFFELVHERLAAGDPPAEAVRRAHRAAAEGEKDPLGGFRRTGFQVIGAGFVPAFAGDRR